jgi:hypothetical protein
MARQNVTLSLPKELVRQARHLAVERGTSLSKLLAEQLQRAVADEERYEEARHRLNRRLARGLDLGTRGKRPASREALHAR